MTDEVIRPYDKQTDERFTAYSLPFGISLNDGASIDGDIMPTRVWRSEKTYYMDVLVKKPGSGEYEEKVLDMSTFAGIKIVVKEFDGVMQPVIVARYLKTDPRPDGFETERWESEPREFVIDDLKVGINPNHDKMGEGGDAYFSGHQVKGDANSKAFPLFKLVHPETGKPIYNAPINEIFAKCRPLHPDVQLPPGVK